MAIFTFALATGGAAAGIWGLDRYHRQQTGRTLADELMVDPLLSAIEQAKTEVKAVVKQADDRYQYFIQRNVDMLVSGKRHAQWQEIAGGNLELFEISPRDKQVNRRIARLGGVVVTALLAKFYTPLLILTIPLAFYDIIGQAQYIYGELKETKKLQMQHLLLPFSVGLWSTGYFVIGGLSFLLFAFIMKITLQVQDRTRKELVNILGEQPRLVWVLVDGLETEILFEHLQAGDLLVVQAGQMIPVDGIVTQGEASIDQQRLTGESQPVEKGAGDHVLAATVVLSGKVFISVEKTGAETLAAQIGDVLANTLDYHLTIEERGKELGNNWLYPSLTLTGLATILRGLQGTVAVLSAMPGFDMVFLGPITLLNYLNLASRNHVLIKDGRSLELLRKVDTVIFDKTGTLTLEQPQVKAVHICTESDLQFSEETILTYAAAAEQRQGHPIAKAIIDAANERDLILPTISDAHYELGYGLRVWLEPDTGGEEKRGTSIGCSESNIMLRVGSKRFMDMESVFVPTEIMEIEAGCHEVGNSLVMIAVEDTLVGAIELQPTIRSEAHAVVAALHERGLETAIISGDHEAPTRTLAHELDIDRYFANVLPEEKAAFVEKLQMEGKTVCFVGDGINDAIALKKSEVSISLRGATTIATDTAQIVLMNQTLENLPVLFDLSHELERNLMTSLVLVTVPCFFVIGSVFFLNAGVPLAVGAYSITFAAGIANAMSPILRDRFTRQSEPKEKEETEQDIAPSLPDTTN